jgi:antitoxin (DNA-binding transcriptional repressor) of toxin-antitoxin stability system
MRISISELKYRLGALLVVTAKGTDGIFPKRAKPIARLVLSG